MSDTFSECASTRPAVPAHAGEDTLGRPRVAVVLAAGRSERLADVTGGGSKALIRVGGLSLVDRAVRNLLAARIERVLVIVGYQAGVVATVANQIAPGRARAPCSQRTGSGVTGHRSLRPSLTWRKRDPSCS
jgi:CTP:molybdopterin cytidylyltransferase MocA